MDAQALAAYVKEKMGEKRVEDLAYEAKVSRATIYNLLDGKPPQPKSMFVYENLAFGLGQSRSEQRGIFKELLKLAGHIDLTPSDADIDARLDKLIIEQIRLLRPDLYAEAEKLARNRLSGLSQGSEGEKDSGSAE